MINKFKYGVDYTLRQYRPLDDFQFCTDDTVKDLFVKYGDPEVPQLLFQRIDLEPKDIGQLGDAFNHLRTFKGTVLIEKAL